MQATPRSAAAAKREKRPPAFAVILAGVILNLALGLLVSSLKLPVFLDAIGTIAVTLLLGIPAGVIAGVLTVVVGSLIQDPAMISFGGTQAAIAIYVGLTARAGLFRTVLRSIVASAGLGVVAAIVSAPVIVKLFGGVTDTGSGTVTSFFLNAGHSIIKSVFLTGISCEPLDKAIQCLLALCLIRSLPKSFLRGFAKRGYLEENRFLP